VANCRQEFCTFFDGMSIDSSTRASKRVEAIAAVIPYSATPGGWIMRRKQQHKHAAQLGYALESCLRRRMVVVQPGLPHIEMASIDSTV
jgi:hypothetical protein